MIFVKFFALLPLHLLVNLLCWFLAPVLPLFAIGRDTLPGWLSWFQTPDAPLDGDSGFAKIFPPDKWPRYLRRVLWLIRNPGYGFAWTVLAYRPKSKEFHWYGTVQPKNREDMGWYYVVQPDGHFEFSCRFPSLPGRTFRFRFGWRIWGVALDPYWGGPQKYIFTINPAKS